MSIQGQIGWYVTSASKIFYLSVLFVSHRSALLLQLFILFENIVDITIFHSQNRTPKRMQHQFNFLFFVSEQNDKYMKA